MAAFPFSFDEILVQTSFGKTNVIVAGNKENPSLFLVHGLNSAAPFALDCISFLLDTYQIFAVDVLGQPNKSDFVRLSKKDASYGKWLLEITNHFKIDNVTLCGISFGTFPILKSLLIDDVKVKEVFLISPAGIINGNFFKTIFSFFIPFKNFTKTKKESYLIKCLHSFLNNFDDILKKYYREVFLNFKMDVSITPNFKVNELLSIKTPITIIASKNDYFVPALKLKKKVDKNINSIKNFIVLENSKHIPSKETLENTFKSILA